jgi:hypothetical protein
MEGYQEKGEHIPAVNRAPEPSLANFETTAITRLRRLIRTSTGLWHRGSLEQQRLKIG